MKCKRNSFDRLVCRIHNNTIKSWSRINYISEFLFLKTVYFYLWFLWKSIPRSVCIRWSRTVKGRTSEQILSLLLDEINQIKAAGREFLEPRGTGIRVPIYLRYTRIRVPIYLRYQDTGSNISQVYQDTGSNIFQVYQDTGSNISEVYQGTSSSISQIPGYGFQYISGIPGYGF